MHLFNIYIFTIHTDSKTHVIKDARWTFQINRHDGTSVSSSIVRIEHVCRLFLQMFVLRRRKAICGGDRDGANGEGSREWERGDERTSINLTYMYVICICCVRRN